LANREPLLEATDTQLALRELAQQKQAIFVAQQLESADRARDSPPQRGDVDNGMLCSH
jgi:hypothetical protein